MTMKQSFTFFIARCIMVVLVTAIPSIGLAKQKIASIVIEGNQRVEVETIRSYLNVKEGDVIDGSAIDSSLKRLFATGLFADVSMLPKQGTLLIKVLENPLINEVVFEGNSRIKTENLSSEIQLKARTVYSKTGLQRDIARLIEIYRKSGRFSATIEPKIIELPHNRVNLVFEIDEGAKTSIKKIKFIGNKNVSDEKLSGAIHTKEARWYRFFSGNDTYDADRLEFDKELLRRYYNSIGYADFKVISVIAELTLDRTGFLITFSLEEGNQYQFGEIKVDSRLQDLDKSLVENLITTDQGDTFDSSAIQQTADAMIKYFTENGYAFVDVDPYLKRDPATQKVNVRYVIHEGAKVYVNRINIRGNVRTADDVIRREFRLVEGDPYNASKVQRSEQRIKNLGFFDKVELKNQRTDEDDKVDIDLTVSEHSTGELNFGAGFSTADGALANIGIRERNLLGKGQDLRLELQRAERRMDLDLGFTEPYFMGRNISAGFDLFSFVHDLRRESSFSSEAQGLTVRIGYDITEYLKHSLRYSLRNDNITDVTEFTSRFIRDQLGENTTSMFGHSFTYDKRDSRFSPTDGYFLRFNQDVAGLGGNSKFFRHEFRGGYFMPFMENSIVLALHGNIGNVVSYGSQDIRINERFFVGGDDLRGFRTAGVGPRDSTSTDALGGNNYYTMTAELGFPLGLPEELKIRGAAFIDAGSLWGIDAKGSEIVDENSLRAASGIGIAWRSPIGPIRMDMAQPWMKESFDRTQVFRVSFGTRF